MDKQKYILSFSGGKDSTFLLLELIRRKYPLDEVVFFDTGWEFPVMYEHIEKCKKMCEENGIKFVTLHPEKSFDYLMFEKPRKDGRYGWSWCGANGCRWGTGEKLKVLNEYAELNKDSIVYIGIAYDEQERLEKEFAEYKRFPLNEWGIIEAECLKGCYAAGFDWGGMYEHLDRLSCKYCACSNMKELRNIRRYYPEVWDELKEYQLRTYKPLKTNNKYGDVFQLEKRFELEEERQSKGLSITNKEFYRELKNRLDIQNG